MDCVIVWLKRATGIGYEDFPPLTPMKLDARMLKYNTDDLVVQTEQLERDLRRRGKLDDNGE